MLDPSAGHQTRKVVDRNQPGRDVFPLIEIHWMLKPTILHQEREAGVAHDRRIGNDPTDTLEALTAVAGSLAQFSLGRVHGRGVPTVHHAAGHFQFDGVGTMTVLLDHDEMVVPSQGDHIHPVDTVDDEDFMLLRCAWRHRPVSPQAENSEVADGSGANPFPRFDHIGKRASRAAAEKSNPWERVENSVTLRTAPSQAAAIGFAEEGASPLPPGIFSLSPLL